MKTCRIARLWNSRLIQTVAVLLLFVISLGVVLIPAHAQEGDQGQVQLLTGRAAPGGRPPALG